MLDHTGPLADMPCPALSDRFRVLLSCLDPNVCSCLDPKHSPTAPHLIETRSVLPVLPVLPVLLVYDLPCGCGAFFPLVSLPFVAFLRCKMLQERLVRTAPVIALASANEATRLLEALVIASAL